MARAWRERVNAPTPDPITHSWLDDAHALVAGSLFVALGMTMFAYAGLLTGGVAGIAFLISYASGISVALLFFGLSLPFFVLAWRRLGPAFTLKSFAAVALVSICTALAPKVVRFEFLDPWLASVLGGFLIGFGLLALLRHGASVGGVNIVAQWLQRADDRGCARRPGCLLGGAGGAGAAVDCRCGRHRRDPGAESSSGAVSGRLIRRKRQGLQHGAALDGWPD